MKKYSLSGAWTLRTCEEDLPALVPGSVYTDLLANGKIEDPYWRDNELSALALMEEDYTYNRVFTLPPDFLLDGVQLVCEGLDTLAEITINDSFIGCADNMHRQWRFDLQDALCAGENSIAVTLRSPTRYIAQKDKECFADGSTDAMRGFTHLRKAHCMFGWDWGARLPDAGIWKEIYLERADGARIDDVFIRQTHNEEGVTLTITPAVNALKSSSENKEYDIKAKLTAPSGAQTEYRPIRSGDIIIGIINPELWYPHGLGEQPLYTVTIVLTKDGEEIDRAERRIGLRTMEVRREPDEWGESFSFCVNGIRFFAMGADYIPEDHLLPRMNPVRTRRLLQDCVAANMNCIRVWGGAFYPFDWFYDICDELGLVVWQDFMFACAVIELTPHMRTNIQAELIDNIKRLRHHASLGLFCGNNEMEWQIGEKVWRMTPKQYGDYFRMYESLFPDLVRQYAPQTFYWPASPSSGGAFDEPNGESKGDAHYWDVWHGGKPFTAYRDYYFRFLSEFGFQSFPDKKTIDSFTLPEDRNVFSYVMEKHQRNASANGTILRYLGQTFLYPADFETLIYASQLLQAEAIKYGVEHFRRHRGRCMGAVYWQLNDCWPVASWASIDYFGRWKALHYYAKRFFAPILLSACEEGFLTQGADVNTEPFTMEKSVRLSVANETLSDFSGVVRWALRDACAHVLKSGQYVADVPRLSSIWLPKEEFADANLYEHYVSFELEKDGAIISSGTCLFAPPKHFRFADPKLTVTVDGDMVTVHACAYAKSVEIISPDADVLFDDNFFDMNAGEKTVRVLRGQPGRLSAHSVFTIR